MALLHRDKSGKTLYAVAYQTRSKADVIYLHAKDRGDARAQLLAARSLLPKNARIADIAPAILNSRLFPI